MKQSAEEAKLNNQDNAWKTEVMNQMHLVIALQGKLLAQNEELESLKTENFRLQSQGKSWKQEVRIILKAATRGAL